MTTPYHSVLLVQDEFASLPAVIPEGPVALLGLVCNDPTPSLDWVGSISNNAAHEKDAHRCL